MTSTVEIGGPYLYALWADIDLVGNQLAIVDKFYSEVHLPEVLRHNPGFDVAMRGEAAEGSDAEAVGFEGARYVAFYGVGDERGMEHYLRREDRPSYTVLPPLFPGALEVRGRAFYRRTATESAGTRETTAVVLAAERESGSPEPALRREGMSACGFHRASRYVIAEGLDRGGMKSPHVMTLYEAGSEAAGTCLRKFRESARLGQRAGEVPRAVAYRVVRIAAMSRGKRRERD